MDESIPLPSPASAAPSVGLLYLLLVVLTLVTMGRSVMHEFVDWDDRSLIADNPDFNSSPFPAVLRYWKPEHVDGSMYMPVTETIWATLASVARTPTADARGSLLNPWLFHFANLVLHAACVCLIFTILREFFTDLPAWLGAAIFAVHPVQVETVAWASETKDLLAALLGFISLFYLIRFRKRERWSAWVFATIAFVFAMLSKPSAVALPVEAIVIDVLLLRSPIRRSINSLWFWFALALPIILIARNVQPPLWPTGISIAQRPLVALDTIAFYIVRLFLPIHFTFDFGRTPLVALAQGWRSIWLLPIFILALLITTHRRLPSFTAGCLIALAAIVPALGLYPFMAQDYSTVSDHYLYPAMLGIAIACASVVELFSGRWSGKLICPPALAIIALLAARSAIICGMWASSESLFSQALLVNPRSSSAHAGMGLLLAQSGDSSAALNHLQTAIDLNPHNAMAIMGLADLQLRAGNFDAAADEYEKLFAIYHMQPNFDPKLGAAGEMVIASRLVHRGDLRGAIAALKQAREWNPLDPRIDRMLSRVMSISSTRPAQ